MSDGDFARALNYSMKLMEKELVDNIVQTTRWVNQLQYGDTLETPEAQLRCTGRLYTGRYWSDHGVMVAEDRYPDREMWDANVRDLVVRVCDQMTSGDRSEPE